MTAAHDGPPRPDHPQRGGARWLSTGVTAFSLAPA